MKGVLTGHPQHGRAPAHGPARRWLCPSHGKAAGLARRGPPTRGPLDQWRSTPPCPVRVTSLQAGPLMRRFEGARVQVR
jgi:hypothetical protein